MWGKGQREVITEEVKVQGDKGSVMGSHDDMSVSIETHTLELYNGRSERETD